MLYINVVIKTMACSCGFLMTLAYAIKFTRHLQHCYNLYHFLQFCHSQHCKTDRW